MALDKIRQQSAVDNHKKAMGRHILLYGRCQLEGFEIEWLEATDSVDSRFVISTHRSLHFTVGNCR